MRLTMKCKHLNLAIFGNIYQTKKNCYVEVILQKLASLGMAVCIEKSFAEFLVREFQTDLSHFARFDSAASLQADVAISIGGDGTFLGTAAKIGACGIPILGINTGRLGFLADVLPEEIDASLDALSQGNYVVEERTALQVWLNGRPSEQSPYALNEVAVLKHDNSSLIEISTHVNGQHLTDFLADGLMVSTPTGSTGYSLSVGGPILMPDSGTLCISAVAPHSLSVRPVVVRDDVEVEMRVDSRSGNFLLSVDGHSQSLPDSTLVTVRRASHAVRVIKIAHKHFFETLRDKLLWGADQRK